MFWPPHRGTTVSQVGSSHQDLAALLNSRVTQSTRLVQISICGRAGPVQAELPPSAAGFITSAQYQNTTGGEEGRCCGDWWGWGGSQAKTACLLSQHHDRSCLRALISLQRRRKSDKRSVTSVFDSSGCFESVLFSPISCRRITMIPKTRSPFSRSYSLIYFRANATT